MKTKEEIAAMPAENQVLAVLINDGAVLKKAILDKDQEAVNMFVGILRQADDSFQNYVSDLIGNCTYLAAKNGPETWNIFSPHTARWNEEYAHISVNAARGAAESNNAAHFKSILQENDRDPQAFSDDDKYSTLIHSIRSHNTEIFRTFIQHYPRSVDLQNLSRLRTICTALAESKTEIALEFVNEVIDQNTVTHNWCCEQIASEAIGLGKDHMLKTILEQVHDEDISAFLAFCMIEAGARNDLSTAQTIVSIIPEDQRHDFWQTWKHSFNITPVDIAMATKLREDSNMSELDALVEARLLKSAAKMTLGLLTKNDVGIASFIISNMSGLPEHKVAAVVEALQPEPEQTKKLLSNCMPSMCGLKEFVMALERMAGVEHVIPQRNLPKPEQAARFTERYKEALAGQRNQIQR